MDDQTSSPGKGSDPIEPEFEKELLDEGFTLEGREAPVVQPKPEADKKDPEKPEDKKEDDPEKPGDKKSEDKGKDPAKDPAKKEEPEAWRQMIAKKRQEQGKSKAAEPEKPVDPAKPDPSKPNPDEPSELKKPELTEEQKSLADKYGIEHEDFHKLFPTPKVEKEVVKSGLTPEQEALLTSVQTERDSLLIEKGFNADFDTNVLPLLREEYPKGLTDDKIAEVKKTILEKLQDEKYSLVPLDLLYRGEKAFRGLVKAPVKGPDNGGRIPDKVDPSKIWDFDNASEEDVKAPGFPFDEYSEYMAKKGKKA